MCCMGTCLESESVCVRASGVSRNRGEVEPCADSEARRGEEKGSGEEMEEGQKE